jgi:NAD(P)-dependent dehydrogenase (short-subunit alcohol dehydrogenase family)
MHAVIFGGLGYLGSEITSCLDKAGWKVTPITSRIGQKNTISTQDPEWLNLVGLRGPIDGIVWAQGLNAADSLADTSREEFLEVFDANVWYVIHTLRAMYEHGIINNPARAVILSSVWQELSRERKFSYSVSKGALKGLVGSISADFAESGLTLNAVLPGVVDSPMAKENLSPASLSKITHESLGSRLVTAQEISSVVHFLLDSSSSGISGQSIVVDNGWSRVRRVED